MLLSSGNLLVLALPSALARDIVFPPLIPQVNPYHDQHPLYAFSNGLEDIDIVGRDDFPGLTTFGHLPYVKCFAEDGNTPKYDIAYMGAPFDTVSRRESSRGLLAGSYATFSSICFPKRLQIAYS